MKRFINELLKFYLLALIPFLLLLIGYFILDPFKTVKSYEDYSFSHVIPNRDYVSTEMFLKNYKAQQYNSFIFGSSRTIGFNISSWSKYLSKKDKAYMFDASSESIYGIYNKLKLIDKLNVKIDNAIILLDRDCTFEYDTNPDSHLFVKHPSVSGESKFLFQCKFIKAYFDPTFLYCYYSYLYSKKYQSYMGGYIEFRNIRIDKITNEIKILDQEKELSLNSTLYYAKREDVFYTRLGEKYENIEKLNSKNKFMLNEILRIFKKHKTKYKMIITPIYDQVKFSKNDIKSMKMIFGNKLFDFSGKNELTDSITNYYEIYHFRPKVGDLILHDLYCN